MGALLVVAFLVAQADGRAQDGPPAAGLLSVCDVVAHDPTPLNGKLVLVRGRLAGGGEGFWLVDECKEHLVTRGLAWGSDIALSMDGAELAARSWGKMVARIKDLHADVNRDKVLVTILGRLETRGSLSDEVVQMPYGLRRAGFGHMGGSVAQIDVVSVEGVMVELGPAGRRVR
jgi:hypothetical protein